jgi:hypothetical protein
MPRFVILFHETPAAHERPSHWDVMLEAGDILRTWAIAEEPRIGAEIAAESLPDHRLAYLDYEGPVSRDRGEVRRWDAGQYEVDFESDEQLRVRFRGDKLQCRASFTKDVAGPMGWRLALGD